MRQLVALARLLFRHWARASLPRRARKESGRRASAGLFRLAYFVLMGGWGWSVGRLVAKLETHDQQIRGIGFVLLGLAGLATVWSALTRGPTMRGESSPLEKPFLDTLPLRETTRILVGLLERLFVYALGGAALVAAAPGHSGRALLLAFGLSTAGVVGGEALMRVARVTVSPLRIARARAYLIVVGQALFLMCVVQAPMLARSRPLAPLIAGTPAVVARALLDGDGFGSVIAGLAAVLAAGLLVIGLAERVGYDKVELVPTGRPRRSDSHVLVVDRIEDVLRKREPGGRWSTVMMATYTLLVVLGILGFAWSARRAVAADASMLVRGASGLAAFGSFVVVTARASRMATRDVTARPLLAPLPLEPRELLQGKAARLTRDVLTVSAPLLLLFATPWSLSVHLEIAWRVATTLVAVLIVARAAAAIAFLTVGAGSKRGPGGSFVIESVLVLVPLVGVTTSPYAWTAVFPLLALGLVAREAGKSALGCVRWIDDAEEFARETPIWRALLVLAAFQSTQAVASRLAGIGDLDPGLVVAGTRGVASLVLLALTWQARHDRGASVVFRPASIGWLPVAALLGVVTGGVAVGWNLLLRKLHVIPPELSSAARWAPAAIAIMIAPLCEEVFFRGWLYPCVETEVLPDRRWLAVLISGFAFAAAQAPVAVGPAFALGLVTSALFRRTRALGPGLLAHTVHAVVLVANPNGLPGW